MYVFFDMDEGQAHSDRLHTEFNHKIDVRLKAILIEGAMWSQNVLGKQLIITCLLRTEEENEAVGGKPLSAHKEARAGDLRTRHLTPEEEEKLKAHFQNVWGKAFLHVIIHDSGAGRHMHVNINFPFKRNTLT